MAPSVIPAAVQTRTARPRLTTLAILSFVALVALLYRYNRQPTVENDRPSPFDLPPARGTYCPDGEVKKVAVVGKVDTLQPDTTEADIQA